MEHTRSRPRRKNKNTVVGGGAGVGRCCHVPYTWQRIPEYVYTGCTDRAGYLLGHPSQACDINAKISWDPLRMYTFLKALDEKRSNLVGPRCQSFTEKNFGLKGTSPLINPNTFTFSNV